MKSIFRFILLVAATSLTLTAVAGEKPRNERERERGHEYGNGHSNANQRYQYYYITISGNGGSLGSEYIQVDQSCNEYPDTDNVGRTIVYGEARIYGHLAGNYVEASESYEGLDACPDNNNSVGKGSKQSIALSVGELAVTAECTGQSMQRMSETHQNKYLGQTTWETVSRIGRGNFTETTNDGSCVITAMDSVGNTETFGTDAYTFFQVGDRRYR